MKPYGVIYDASWERREQKGSSLAPTEVEIKVGRLEPEPGKLASRRGVICRAGLLPPTLGLAGGLLPAALVPLLGKVANFLITFSFVGLVFLFGPIARAEIGYQVKRGYFYFFPPKEEVIDEVHFADLMGKEIDTSGLVVPEGEFSLLIPKIEVETQVIANVNADDLQEYREALKRGVAHAAGTVFPGMKGTTYLFAHSTDAPWNINQYNAIFYLLNKLEEGDEIIVYFFGGQYRYRVFDKKIVSAEETAFFNNREEEILVLQTCWPPGTTQKRLLVLGERDF